MNYLSQFKSLHEMTFVQTKTADIWSQIEPYNIRVHVNLNTHDKLV